MSAILSLYDHSGEWSRPYREAGYHVIQVDTGLTSSGVDYGPNLFHVRLNEDVRLLRADTIRYATSNRKIHGILAAPPCTVFASSGAWVQRSDDDMRNGLSMVDAVLRLVWALRPKWWALENPVGKLRRYLGPPVYWWDPCDYGDPYTKKTGLWGDFAVPQKNPVPATEGSKVTTKLTGFTDEAKRRRSVTPAGFARAFFLANP